MRNLKKVLSLSLALVMLLGLMVVGAGAATTFADLKDKDEISENYAEAVDLLTALGVLEGNENDEFMPTGTLTREAAAKIVAYLALGVDAAEKLSVTSAPFKDVAANRWSAGYIAYCANVGIIDGDGKGSFYPTQTVTGYQFAKMLLGVLGYGAKDEYVGTNWALNVATDGVTVGLFDRLSNVGNTPATREEAAQLAFNSLTKPMVAYSELYGTYSSYTYQYGQQELLGTKADKIFKVDCVGTENAYGYNYHYWKYQGSKAAITDEYLSDIILGTVTGGTKGAMYKDYDWNETYTIVENGVWDTTTEKGTTYVTAHSSAALKSSTTPVIGYNGQTVTLVDEDNDGDVDKLVVVTEYLAEVTKVTAATASADRTVTIKAYIPNTNTGYETVTTTIETEDYAVGDMILVDPNMTLAAIQGSKYTTNELNAMQTAFGANVLGTRQAETISGATVSAYYLNSPSKADGSVTTGGVKYNYNGVFMDKDALGYDLTSVNDPYTLNKATYNFYLDSNGNVIGAKVVEDAIKDFAYILAVGEDAFKMDNVVNVLLSDGTVGTYNVSAQSTGYNYKDATGALDTNNKIYDTTANDNATGLGTEGVGHIYGYSFDSDGKIVLTALSNKYGNPAKYVKGSGAVITQFVKGYSTISYKPTSGGAATPVFATDTTVFAYVYNGTVTLFTGKSNAPSITNKEAAIATQTINGTTYATFVVVLAEPENALTDNYVYVTNASYIGYSTDTKGANVYYYEVIKAGVKTIIAIDSKGKDTITSNGIGVYQYGFNADLFISDEPNRVESGEYSVAVAPVSAVATGVEIDVSSNNNVIVQHHSGSVDQQIQYVITEDTTITEVVAGKPVVENATFNVGDTVTVVYGKVGNLNVAKAVFITARAAGTTPIAPGGVGGVSEGATISLTGANTGTIAVVDRYNTERDAMTIATDALEANGFTVNQVVGTSVYATAANGTQVYFTVSTTVAYKVNLVKATGNNVAMTGPSAVYATAGTPVEVTLTLSGSTWSSETGSTWSSETGSATSDNGSATVASVTDTKSGNTMTVKFTITTTGVAAEGAIVTIGW